MRALLLAVAVVLVPAVAAACPVCFSGTDEYRATFILTTAFMTTLPLVLVGSIAVWVWQRSKKLQQIELERASARASEALPTRF